MWCWESPTTANTVASANRASQLLPGFAPSYSDRLWESRNLRATWRALPSSLRPMPACNQLYVYLQGGLGTLARSSCGHSCSVGALGKQLRPVGVGVGGTYAGPRLTGSGWGWTATAQQGGGIRTEEGWWSGQGFLGRVTSSGGRDGDTSCWFRKPCFHGSRQIGIFMGLTGVVYLCPKQRGTGALLAISTLESYLSPGKRPSHHPSALHPGTRPTTMCQISGTFLVSGRIISL